MEDCIFCKILNGEIPCFKVYEDDNCLAFLDLSNFTEGHTLVIPKKHYRFVWDIEDKGKFFDSVSKIIKHYKEDLGYQYVDTLTFGRMVPHAHIHLVPHNGEHADWKKALEPIGNMQEDSLRRLTPEKGAEIAKKFAMD